MSGGFNPVNLASQVALGVATGGSSIMAQLALRMVSSIGQQVIQTMGQQLGLPQGAIDLAQGAFAGSVGDRAGLTQNLDEATSAFSGALGASPAEQGDFSREVNDAVNDMATSLAGGDDFKAAKSGGKGGSWLMALAEALGRKLDQMADEMGQMAEQISDDTPSLTTMFSAKSQQFGILMNAATTSIKTIGESLANTARKN